MVARWSPNIPGSEKRESFSSSKNSDETLILIGSNLATGPPLDLEMSAKEEELCWVAKTNCVHPPDRFKVLKLAYFFKMPPQATCEQSHPYLHLSCVLPLAFGTVSVPSRSPC